MQSVLLHCRPQAKSLTDLQFVLATLRKVAKQVSVTDNVRHNLDTDLPAADYDARYDLAVVLGGDGSILSLVHSLRDLRTPILGVAGGSLGFLTEVVAADLPAALDCWHDGHCTHDPRALLEVTHHRADGSSEQFIALNECVVGYAGVARLTKLAVAIGDEQITTYKADGLLLSTPTGSTAYNLAVGGPIVYPRLRTMILSPISPHSFSQKPLVLPAEKVVTITPAPTNAPDLVLTIDGQITVPFAPTDSLTVRLAEQSLSLVRLADSSFFGTIKRKLEWG